MSPAQASLFSALQDWFLAFGSLLFTFLLAATSHKLLHKGMDQQWPAMRQLAPGLSNLIYIFGINIFANLAPLHGKIAVWIDSSIYIFTVVILLRMIQQAALLCVEWSVLKTFTSETVQQGFIPLMRNGITLFIFLSGAIMILRHFDYDVMSLVTALGMSSLAVGLAAKDTLSNMISGFIMIVDRNLKPGDRINLSGNLGDVEEIGLRSTRIKTLDGNILIVPNTELVNTKILNLSLPSRKAVCSSTIRVDTTVSFGAVKSIILSVLAHIELVLQEEATTVNLLSLSEGYQLIQIGFWISDIAQSSSVLSKFHEILLEQLRREGIQLLPPEIARRNNSLR